MPHVKANGVNLHYELSGPAAAPVIVFSHSIGATLDMWDAQVAAFAGRYRCLRYDTRGHGSSEVVDRPARVDDLADDMAGLLDALGIAKAHVVGLSLGGMTAQAFALRHADRLERLVLIATTAKMDPTFWQERAALVRREGYGSFIETVLTPRWFTPDFAKRSPETIAAFRERFPQGLARLRGLLRRDRDARPARSGSARFEAPTLIMVGADDPATPVGHVGGPAQPHPGFRAPHPAAPGSPSRRRAARPGEPLSRRLPRTRPGRNHAACRRRLLRGRPCQPQSRARRRARRAFARRCRRVRHALAGLHHAPGVGRDLGRPDAGVEDALVA